MEQLERLEDRIAPASTFTFNDVDGDLVTITSSAGDLNAAGVVNLADMTGNTNNLIDNPRQLTMLDLSGSEFLGATISVTAKPQKFTGQTVGDGFVNVGWLNGGSNTFNSVKVDGDLAEIDAGNGNGVAIKKLEVQSMGIYGTTTGGNSGLTSTIAGGVDTFSVKGDMKEVFVEITSGDLKKLTVKGSLIGGNDANEGGIKVTQNLGSAVFGGSVLGGTGSSTGFLFANNAQSISIAGDVVGNSGPFSGYLAVSAEKVVVGGNVIGGSSTFTGGINGKALTIKGDMIGGSGDTAGFVSIVAGGSLALGGSLVGGTNDYAGYIGGSSMVKSVSIGGNVLGGSGYFSGAIDVGGNLSTKIAIGRDLKGGTGLFSGYVEVTNAAKISIGGSLYGASGVFADAAGGIAVGGITEGGVVKDISIKGSVIEGMGRAFIMAKGLTGQASNAIGKLTIGGNVGSLDVLAGYEPNNNGDFSAMNGDASIGAVKVTGNWAKSNLIAGVETNNTAVGFNTSTATLINGHNPDIVARIASFAVGGSASGFPESGYYCGFMAEMLPSKFKIGRVTMAFSSPSDVLGIGSTYEPNSGLNFLADNVSST